MADDDRKCRWVVSFADGGGLAGRGCARGFTLIELLVTIMMVALILGGVLRVLTQTETGTKAIHGQLQRELALETCLDLLCEDLRAAAAQDLLVMVQSEAIGPDQDTSRLLIQFRPAGAGQDEIDKTIEWVSAPRYGREDLVLFRRIETRDRETTTEYIPVCEGVYSFKVEKIDRLLLEITARAYRTDPPDPGALLVASRTFCVERFRTTEGES